MRGKPSAQERLKTAERCIQLQRVCATVTTASAAGAGAGLGAGRFSVSFTKNSVIPAAMKPLIPRYMNDAGKPPWDEKNVNITGLMNVLVSPISLHRPKNFPRALAGAISAANVCI